MWRVLFLYIVKKRDMSYGQEAIWTPQRRKRFTGIITPSALEKKLG
jgi:hypothetical protein